MNTFVHGGFSTRILIPSSSFCRHHFMKFSVSGGSRCRSDMKIRSPRLCGTERSDMTLLGWGSEAAPACCLYLWSMFMALLVGYGMTIEPLQPSDMRGLMPSA